MIEKYYTLPLYQSQPRIVRGFYHDDMASFLVHGDNHHAPFWLRPMDEVGWRVCHEKTGRRVCFMFQRPLSFQKAMALAKALDDAYGGWSQIANTDDNGTPVVGFRGEPMRIMAQVISEFSKTHRHAVKKEYRDRLHAIAASEMLI